ncbi:MAG: DUF1573 domain-containing protein [Saprospiraceae bacterium]|nr:DUF1573 domain-containing protein [Saprospiraceae bacterium]
MKKILSICLLTIASTLLGTTIQAQTIQFLEVDGQGENVREWNFGNLDKGANGVRTFKYTNTSPIPLIIKEAKATCGCTIPSYKKEPLMQGQTAEIKVKYDTKRVGAFTKYVTLTTNDPTKETIKLKIFGTIKETE